VRPEGLTVRDVELAIGVPAREWKGKCAGVSGLIVALGVVDGGRLAYGHWRGPIARGSHFDVIAKIGLGFCSHGWVALDDGRVLDATRWVFEDNVPYVWLGEDEKGWYDEGGNKFRDAIRASGIHPPPPYEVLAESADLLPKLTPAGQAFVAAKVGTTGRVTVRQASWLASQSAEFLAPHAREIYDGLAAVGLDALVPIDNARSAAT
jgi:hypothetical protein